MAEPGPRCFVAVELPEPLRSELAAASAQLRRKVPGLAAVRAANLHLTVRFLGEVPEPLLDPIETALRDALAAQPPLRLRLSGVGAFPSIARARVLWIGTRDPEPLEELAARVRRATALAPDADDKPFHPHVTLGRFRSRPRASLEAEVAALQGRSFGEATVRELTLFESQLGEGGAKHIARARCALGALA